MVAQALLKKAIAIDPSYGQAHGVLATSHTFGAHMGWEDMATATAVAERAALGGDPGRQRGPLGAPGVGQRLSVQAALRRLTGRIRILALRLNPNFSLAQGYYGLALSYIGALGRGRRGCTPCIAAQSTRPVFGGLLRIAAYAQFSGRNYDEAIRLSREGIRQRGDFVGAHRVLTAAAGMTGRTDIASVALRELRRARPNISLAWIARQMPIKLDAEREHYLEGFRRAGLD